MYLYIKDTIRQRSKARIAWSALMLREPYAGIDGINLFLAQHGFDKTMYEPNELSVLNKFMPIAGVNVCKLANINCLRRALNIELINNSIRPAAYKQMGKQKERQTLPHRWPKPHIFKDTQVKNKSLSDLLIPTALSSHIRQFAVNCLIYFK